MLQLQFLVALFIYLLVMTVEVEKYYKIKLVSISCYDET